MATVSGTSSFVGSLMRTVVTLATGLLLLGPGGVSSADRHVFPVTLTSQPAEASVCSFPDSIVMEIKASPPFPESLVVYRNDVIDTNAPIFVITNSESGVVHLSEIGSANKETAAYKNSDEGAAFMVKCTTSGVEIAGTMYVEGLKYRVSRVETEPGTEPVTGTETGTGAAPGSMSHSAGHHEFALTKDTPHHDTMLQGFAKRKMGSAKDRKDAIESSHTRAKRATGAVKDYYIDVLVLLDFSFYNYWLKQANGDSTVAVQNATEYITYIFNGVNSRFDTISQSMFRLHVVLSGFIVAKTSDKSPWTEGAKEQAVGGAPPKVNAETTLKQLEIYVRERYSTLPAHDHLMLFTEYDLYSTNDDGFRFNNTAGFAFIDTVCQTNGRSISVVEDHGGFQSEATVTHELGHSFGALHDGSKGEGGIEGNNCSSEDRYVMSGGVHPFTEATKRNPWVFSPCSDRYFQSSFDSLVQKGFEESCLLNRTTADAPTSVLALPGQEKGPDDQCRQIYGSESYLCRGTRFGTPEMVCYDMFCRNPALSGTQCTLNTAAHGTCCSNGKQCQQGQCTSLAANDTRCYMSATCPFGQRQGKVYQGKTCDELEPQFCYKTDFRLVCCEMCDKVKAVNNGNDGCTYGDSVLGCVAQSCGVDSAVGRAYDQNCCGTCRKAPTTMTTVAPSVITTVVTTTVIVDEVHALEDLCSDNALTTINGKNETCSAFIRANGQAFCCQPQVLTACCASCRVNKTSDPECPFGDCQNCQDLTNSQVTCTQERRTDCCKTCKDVDLRLTTPAPTSTTTAATTPIPITAKPNTAGPGDGGGDDVTPVVTCVEVLGVTTCGSLQLGPSFALVFVCLLVGRGVLGDGLGQ